MTVRGVVVDLDGTVYRGGTPIPGAADALAVLRERGLRVLFFSHNPTKTPAEYADRLAEIGIEAAAEEVLTAGEVTTRYLADHHADDPLFAIASPGLRAQLREVGLATVGDPHRADVLLASFDRSFDYDALTAGYRALADGETAFVGSDPDVVVPAEEGMVPGSGAIVRAVAGIAERDPDVVLGKPSAEAVEMARAAIGLPPGDCLMVGDRLNTDVAFGERAGMTTAVVRTGVTDDDALAEADVRPDHVIDSLADLPALLEG